MDYFAALQAFVKSVDLGSFSKAAAESGQKVSTVSRHVAALEENLGAALLNRSTRHLHLTEAGRLFYERAAQILADLEEARSATSSLNAKPQGLLRINIPSAFGRRHVMAHMKDFLAAHPDIRLDATLTDTTVDLVETGTDVAVRIGALVDSSLIARKLAPQRRLLVASHAYLSAHGPVQKPEELTSHECLQFALQPGVAWFYRPPSQPATEPLAVSVNGHLRANDSETLRESAVAGMGIALLPTWLVSEDVRAGRLEVLLSKYEWSIAAGARRAIWAVYPPKKIVSPKVRAFIAFLCERFGQPPYWEKP